MWEFLPWAELKPGLKVINPEKKPRYVAFHSLLFKYFTLFRFFMTQYID